jgi:hypothetical protein
MDGKVLREILRLTDRQDRKRLGGVERGNRAGKTVQRLAARDGP